MWFFKDSLFQCYIAVINWVGRRGVGRQAKQAVVNEVWERGEIVMCITLDVHCLQTASMYTKKPKEMGSQLMICTVLKLTHCCILG